MRLLKNTRIKTSRRSLQPSIKKIFNIEDNQNNKPTPIKKSPKTGLKLSISPGSPSSNSLNTRSETGATHFLMTNCIHHLNYYF